MVGMLEVEFLGFAMYKLWLVKKNKGLKILIFLAWGWLVDIVREVDYVKID